MTARELEHWLDTDDSEPVGQDNGGGRSGTGSALALLAHELGARSAEVNSDFARILRPAARCGRSGGGEPRRAYLRERRTLVEDDRAQLQLAVARDEKRPRGSRVDQGAMHPKLGGGEYG